MKLKLYTISLLCLLASSCSSFLDEDVYSLREEEDMFTKYEDADMAVMGIYSILSSAKGYRAPWQCLGTYGTDEAINYTSGQTVNANFYRVSNFSHTAGDPRIADLYQNIYSAIMHTNEAYWQIEKMTCINRDKKNILQAEALFLRSFLYFNLVQLWGDVRLNVDKPDFDTVTERNAVRAPLKEVYEQIVSDIEFAKLYLPISRDEGDVGRATMYAAYGLAAKIYLTMASGSKFGVAGYDFDSEAYYKLAKENANAVMTDGKAMAGYDLLPEYKDVFSAENKYNKEILFDITFCINGPGNAYPKMGGPAGAGSFPYYVSGWAGRCYLRPSMYLALTAYGHTTMTVTENDLITKFVSDDVRFAFNICTFKLNGTTGLPNTALIPNPADWSVCKFSMRTQKIEGYAWQNVPMNHPVLRYSDILLIYAEAAGMLDRNDQTAYDAANLVRQRARAAGKTPDYLADWKPGDFADDDQFMDAILDERLRELCFEGHRRFDLLRTARLFSAIDKMKAAAIAIGEEFPFGNFPETVYAADITNQKYDVNIKPHHVLFPIPQYEMNIITNPDYKQNPGWQSAGIEAE